MFGVFSHESLILVNDHVSFLQVVCLALVPSGETTISDLANDGYVMLALSIISCAIAAWFLNFCSDIAAAKKKFFPIFNVFNLV